MKATIFFSIVCLFFGYLSFRCYTTGKEFDTWLFFAGIFIWLALIAHPKNVRTGVANGVLLLYLIAANVFYILAMPHFSVWLLGMTFLIFVMMLLLFLDWLGHRKRGNSGYGGGDRGRGFSPPPPPLQPQHAPLDPKGPELETSEEKKIPILKD